MNVNQHFETPKKSYIVELYRFLAACGIFWYHSLMITGDASYPFFGGYIFVEFFLILTGYFSFQHIEQHRAGLSGIEMKYASQYVVKKMIRVFPYSTVGIMLFCLLRMVLSHYSLGETIKTVFYLPFQLFFLPMAGLIPRGISQYAPGLAIVWGPYWYISAMLFVLPVLLFIALRKRDFFYFYIVPFGTMIIYGWLFMHYDSVLTWDTYNGLCFSGIIRCVAGILLGGFVYQISGWIRTLKIGKWGLWLLTTIELLSFIGASGLSYCRQAKFDAVIIMFFFICLVIVFSGKSGTRFLHGKIFIQLGKISLPLYCIHSVIYSVVQALFPFVGYYGKVGICFAISFLFAALLVVVCEKWWPVEKIQKILFSRD